MLLSNDWINGKEQVIMYILKPIICICVLHLCWYGIVQQRLNQMLKLSSNFQLPWCFSPKPRGCSLSSSGQAVVATFIQIFHCADIEDLTWKRLTLRLQPSVSPSTEISWPLLRKSRDGGRFSNVPLLTPHTTHHSHSWIPKSCSLPPHHHCQHCAAGLEADV